MMLMSCQQEMRPTADRPDIVLVVIDTLRADRLAIHGAKNSPLPSVDTLAKEGGWFSRAYAQSGWTLPSFVSMWTGLYPHQHRVGRNPHNEAEFGALQESYTTLAESLKEQKYHTGAVINNTFLAPAFGLSQGFDSYMYEGADNSELRSAEATTKEGLQWLEKQSGASFLVLHYMEAHMHLIPKKEHRGRFTPDGKPLVPVPFGAKDAFDMTQRKRSQEEVDYVMGLYDEELWAVEKAIQDLIQGLKSQNRWNWVE